MENPEDYFELLEVIRRMREEDHPQNNHEVDEIEQVKKYEQDISDLNTKLDNEIRFKKNYFRWRRVF
jgi:hypothetical protein